MSGAEGERGVGTIFNDTDRKAIGERIATVTDTAQRRWGKMDVKAMMTHLNFAAQMATGDFPVQCKSPKVFQTFPVKHLFLYVLPFPKGAPTAPKLLTPDPRPFDAIRAELLTVMERIAAGPREGLGPVHPAFGALTYPQWGVATYKHTDHHLRQFGA